MENQEQLKAEVTELLNQILLKLEGVGDVPVIEASNYSDSVVIGKPILGEDGEVDPYEATVDTEVELAIIKDTVKILLKENGYNTGVRLLEKFYTSTCY